MLGKHLLGRATADSTANSLIKHILGNKSDAAVYSAGTTASLMAYLKGLLNSNGWKCVEKSDGACLNNTTDPLFTITGGLILCEIVGFVSTVLVGATNLRLKFTSTVPAATIDLNAGAVACDNDAAGTIYRNVGATSVFTPHASLGGAILDPVTVQQTQFILSAGSVGCLSSAAATGNIKWYMTYKPLSPSAVVVAAA